MSVIVEDGTVVEDANSYNSQAEGDTYFTDRPDANWNDADSDEKDQALIVGCQHFDNGYNWIGNVTDTEENRLYWPRYNAIGHSGRVYSEVIPRSLKEGALEYAELFLAGELGSTQSRETIKEKVGPLEVEYQPGSSTVTWPFVDSIVNDISLGRTGGSAKKLVRF